MSRISSLPSVTTSHWAGGKTFPTTSSWLVAFREGLPGLPPHSLFRRAAQLFSRIGYPSQGPRVLRRKSIRGNVYDRLKIYKVTRPR